MIKFKFFIVVLCLLVLSTIHIYCAENYCNRNFTKEEILVLIPNVEIKKKIELRLNSYEDGINFKFCAVKEKIGENEIYLRNILFSTDYEIVEELVREENRKRLGNRALLISYDYFREDYSSDTFRPNQINHIEVGQKPREVCNTETFDKSVLEIEGVRVRNNELPFFCYNNLNTEKIAKILIDEYRFKEATVLTDAYNYNQHLQRNKSKKKNFNTSDENFYYSAEGIRYGIASGTTILEELKNLFKQAYSGETLFISLSGHGNFSNNTFYIFPYDYHPQHNELDITEKLIEIFQDNDIRPKLKYLKIILDIDSCGIDTNKLEKYVTGNDIALSISKAAKDATQCSYELNFNEYGEEIKGTLFMNAVIGVLSENKNKSFLSKELFGGEKDNGLLWNKFEKMKKKVLKAKKEFPEKYKIIKEENLKSTLSYFETKEIKLFNLYCRLLHEKNGIGGYVKVDKKILGILPYYDCYSENEKDIFITFEKIPDTKCIFCKKEVEKTRRELESDDGEFSFIKIKFYLKPLIPNYKFTTDIYSLSEDKSSSNKSLQYKSLLPDDSFEWTKTENAIEMLYKVEMPNGKLQTYRAFINPYFDGDISNVIFMKNLLLLHNINTIFEGTNNKLKPVDKNIGNIFMLFKGDNETVYDMQKVDIEKGVEAALLKVEKIVFPTSGISNKRKVNITIFNEIGDILMDYDFGEQEMDKEYKINVKDTQFIIIKVESVIPGTLFNLEVSLSVLGETVENNPNKFQLFKIEKYF